MKRECCFGVVALSLALLGATLTALAGCTYRKSEHKAKKASQAAPSVATVTPPKTY